MTIEEQLHTWLSLHKQPRNIYQNAEFYAQNRLNSAEIAPYLNSDATQIEATAIELNLFDCRDTSEKPKDWARENAKFLNYHRSLTPYTLLNGLPFSHYLGVKTGLAEVKNKVVIDVGGGTGQTLVNFFRHGETLTYFLVDPNMRLLHDQFIRIYPQLLTLKMGHILAMGENLPFKNTVADIVLCFAAIDHMADYQQFIKEALRVLKPEGQLLITGHLDVPTTNKAAKLWRQFSIFSPSFLEFITRRWHQFRNRVALDDHTVHFESTAILEEKLKDNGFRIVQSEVVGTELFFILAEKIEDL